MSSETLDRASYYVALEGVTRYGLTEAVKTILRGGLGHAFFPSPPELRIACDRAMRHHEDMRARAGRQGRLEKERDEYRAIPRRTDAELARVKRVYDRFCAAYEKPSEKFVPTLDPALVAQMPDNPKARERMGVA